MTFPGEKLVLGRYCDTSIDDGPELTAKIMRNYGQQVHRSTYRALIPDEFVNTDKIKASDKFETYIGDKLGPAASAEDFESNPEIITLTLDCYEDDEEHQTHMPEVDGIMLEAMDKYIGVEIMVSHGDTVTQGSVRSRKLKMEGNAFGRANSNPIIDTQYYEVKFEDGSLIT